MTLAAALALLAQVGCGGGQTGDADQDGGSDSGDGGVCPDQDGDGYATAECGGDDCDDGDPNINPGVVESEEWQSFPVDADRGTDFARQMTLDPEGTPYVFYFDDDIDDMGYAIPDHGEWLRAALGIGPFNVASIAFDAGGMAHLSYETNDPYELWYVRDAIGEWTTERVSAETTFTGSKVVVGDGQVRIVYELGLARPEQVVGIATKTEEGWSVETIDSACVDLDSAKADGTGAVHVLYHQTIGCDAVTPLRARYATNRSGAWVSETVGTDVSPYSMDLVLTVDGTPVAIVGPEYVPEPDVPIFDQSLHLATRRGGEWTVEQVDIVAAPDMVSSKRLAIDPSGALHVFFRDLTADLQHVTNRSGAWARESILEGVNATSVSVAIDDSAIHLAFNAGAQDVWYAHGPLGAADEPDDVDNDCDGYAW